MQLGVKSRHEQRKQTMSRRTDASRGIQPVLRGDKHTDWPLWQLSLVLAEIASSTAHGGENGVVSDGECEDRDKRDVPDE